MSELATRLSRILFEEFHIRILYKFYHKCLRVWEIIFEEVLFIVFLVVAFFKAFYNNLSLVGILNELAL
jgi:hypothetical protein